MQSNRSGQGLNNPELQRTWSSGMGAYTRKQSLGVSSRASIGGLQSSTPSGENGPSFSHTQNILSNTGPQVGLSGTRLEQVSSNQSWGGMSDHPNASSLSNSGRPGTGHSTSSAPFSSWAQPVWHPHNHSQSVSTQKGVSTHTGRWPSASTAIESHQSASPSTVPSQLQRFQFGSSTDGLRSPSADHPSKGTSTFPFDIPLEPSRKTVRSQSYSGQRSSMLRRPSRPNVLMENTRDDSDLFEVDEDETTGVAGWENNPLTTTMSNPVTMEPIAKPGSSSSRASQHSPKRHHTSHLVRSTGTNYLPLQGSLNPEAVEIEEPLDTYGEEMVAAGTQRAAEHAQATLANAAAQNVERSSQHGQRTSRFANTFEAMSSTSPSGQQRLMANHPASGWVPDPKITFDGIAPPGTLISNDQRTSLRGSAQRKFTSLFRDLSGKIKAPKRWRSFKALKE